MALRVLLADESSTIKRVMQLSLQDYAVNVQNVTVGLDVLDVAAKFKPDIIFIDVLLPKKNGYEVCAELKASSELQGIPVVLIWSGFVELDKDRYQVSKANGHLEKPFEVTTLRNIVKNLVPKTKTQDLSQYLTFPETPKQEVKKPSAQAHPEALSASELQSVEQHVQSSSWGMDAFASPEQFSEINLGNTTGSAENLADDTSEQHDSDLDLISSETSEETSADNNPSWSHKRLERYKLDIDDSDEDDLKIEFDEASKPEPQPASTSVAVRGSTEPKVQEKPTQLQTPQITAAQVEKIIREQTKETLEQLVLKVLPEIAEQVIQRELKRLIAERK